MSPPPPLVSRMSPVLATPSASPAPPSRLYANAGRPEASGPPDGCYVCAFNFLYPPEVRDEWGGDGQGKGQGEGQAEGPSAAPSSQPPPSMPLWALGQWTHLGKVCDTGRVGADLAVVQGRLYISGGVDESDTSGMPFDGTVSRWSGTYADLPPPLRTCPPPPHSPSTDAVADAAAVDGAQHVAHEHEHEMAQLAATVNQRLALELKAPPTAWRVMDALGMPKAMHAHSAITIPLLPA